MDLVLGSSEFNPSATAVNSQLVCLSPVRWDSISYLVFLLIVLVSELVCIIKKVKSELKTSLHSTKWTIKEYGARAVKEKGPVRRDVTNNKE